MRLPAPLHEGRLVKRYKRFLADVELPDGTLVTAHCANPGSMLGVAPQGSPVWLSKPETKGRKLAYSWELVEVEDFGQRALVGINTNNPNRIAAEALEKGIIPELAGYETCRREVKYRDGSRVDFLLDDPRHGNCYLEIKNVHLMRRADRIAEFPDSVTKRGLKHLHDLAAMVQEGHRAILLFIIQRSDCTGLAPAADLDPDYAEGLVEAQRQGVEILAWDCEVTTAEIVLRRPVPLHLP